MSDTWTCPTCSTIYDNSVDMLEQIPPIGDGCPDCEDEDNGD